MKRDEEFVGKVWWGKMVTSMCGGEFMAGKCRFKVCSETGIVETKGR